MKNKGLTKFLTAIGVVAVIALVVGAILTSVVYENVLKPQDFSANGALPSGDGTGYYRHCYNELTDEEKAVYNVVVANIYDMPEKIEIPSLGSGDLNKIFTAISYDNPDLFCIGTKCSVYREGLKSYFEPTYIMTLEEFKKQSDEASKVANTILMGTKAYTSIYEKELYVHDYIINHCSYSDPNTNPNANSIYGCLVEGKAGCEGYARAFQYLMNMLNIDNRLVTGESAEDGVNYTGHMWNYVVLDGEGYFVDTTWDDPKGTSQVLRHTYFNVTTNDVLVKRKSINQVIPFTTATKYNYFVYESAYFTTGAGEQFSNGIDASINNAIQRGYKCAELKFPDSATLQQAKSTMFDQGVVYTAFKDAGLIQDLSGSKVYYSIDDKMNVICLFF